MWVGIVLGTVFKSFAELLGRRTERPGEFGELAGAEHKQHDQQDNQPFLSSKQSNPPW